MSYEDKQTDGRTDGQTGGWTYRETDMVKPMVAIRNFAKAPKNTSLGPFSVYEHSSDISNRSLSIAHDVQGLETEENKKQLTSQCFCKEDKNTKKDQNIILGGGKLFSDFRFKPHVLENKLPQKRGMGVYTKLKNRVLDLLEENSNRGEGVNSVIRVQLLYVICSII